MDRRYTDRDVKNDERLYQIALEYLGSYSGTFQVLIDMKRAYITGHRLNVVQIRTILNCMLADPFVVNMPVPEIRPFDASAVMLTNYRGSFGADEEDAQPRRPLMMMLRSRIKVDFSTSMNKTAYKIHQVDHRKTPVVYRPLAPERSEPRGWSKFHVDVHHECGTHLSDSTIQLLDLETANRLVAEGKRSWCHTCDRMSEVPWIIGDDGQRSKPKEDAEAKS